MTALDRFYEGMQNVVLRDAKGNPSVFVRHARLKSSDLSSVLPGHTHPAFIVNGEEVPAVLIGKYDGSLNADTGAVESLPGREPWGANSQGPTPDQYLTAMRKFDGATGLTIADWGLIMLEAQKYAAENDGAEPGEGNTWGGCSVWTWGTAWERNKAVQVGDKCSCMGWLYECLTAHTTSETLLPPDAPGYWKRLYKAGGDAVKASHKARHYQRGYNYTGTGPAEWNFKKDPTMEADLMGNGSKVVYGIRLINGEVQILANNDAADPAADLSASSTAWKAIKPHSADSGYDLVATGATDTVHMTYTGGKITFAARAVASGEYSSTTRYTAFNALGVDSSTIPVVPSILYELGLLGLPGCTLNGYARLTLIQNTETLMHVGCGYGAGGDVPYGAGYCRWGRYSFNYVRDYYTEQSCCRLCAVEA